MLAMSAAEELATQAAFRRARARAQLEEIAQLLGVPVAQFLEEAKQAREQQKADESNGGIE
jgi:hypothetical protein